jgi:DNA repair exonuclease SbcCD ATPase subunit
MTGLETRSAAGRNKSVARAPAPPITGTRSSSAYTQSKSEGVLDRALVPVRADTDRSPAGETDGGAPASRPVERPEPDTTLAILQTKLADAEARLSDLRADVERERGERLQERDRADQLTNEVASLARQLAQTIQDATERERGIRDRANQLADEVASLARQLAQTVQDATERERGIRDQLADARAAVTAERARLAALTSEMERLRARLAALTSETEGLRARPWWERLVR